MKTAVEQREPVDQHHAHERAEKRRQRHPRDFTKKASANRHEPVGKKDQTQDAAQRSAAGNSKHLRTRERIAEQGLKDDAAGRHAAADDDSQKNPRKPCAKKYLSSRIGRKQITPNL